MGVGARLPGERDDVSSRRYGSGGSSGGCVEATCQVLYMTGWTGGSGRRPSAAKPACPNM